MPWITTKEGKHINTDWFDEDEKRKEKQIAENEKQAAEKNGKFKKRVSQEELTREKIQEEIVGKDSYILSPEYQALSKEAGKHWDKMHGNDDKIKELEDALKSERTLKPKSEWDDEDEFQSLIGKRPYIYTEKGKQISSELEKLTGERRSAEKEWSAITDKIAAIDSKHTESSKERYLKSTEKISNDVKSDYFGFKTHESTTPYIDSLLEKGKAHVVSMSPKRYIEECAHKIFPNSSLEKTIRGRNVDDIKKYMTMMEEGTKFDTPYLNYRDQQQEGLHRAIAAYMLGIDEIPVIIVRKER